MPIYDVSKDGGFASLGIRCSECSWARDVNGEVLALDCDCTAMRIKLPDGAVLNAVYPEGHYMAYCVQCGSGWLTKFA